MSNLVILTERDIMDYLVASGVRPSLYYLDFERFKKESTYFENVDIVIIFQGLCGFNSVRVCDLAERLSSRVGVDISSVNVISDIELKLPTYYKYTKTPLECKLVTSGKEGKSLINLFNELKYTKSEKCHFIDNSDELLESAMTRLQKSLSSSSTTGLIVPNLNNLS